VSDLSARTVVDYEFGGVVRGADGFEIEFVMDDSFRSWRQIVRWNLHYRHWAALRMNARHLFTKVIGRKLWRR
jgi:hypothetical protein